MEGEPVDTSISDEQWRQISAVLTRTRGARGRRRGNDRTCYEAAVWALVNCGSLADWPSMSPRIAPCRQRLLLWRRLGALQEAFATHIATFSKEELTQWRRAVEQRPSPGARGKKRAEQACLKSVFGAWKQAAREILANASAVEWTPVEGWGLAETVAGVPSCIESGDVQAEADEEVAPPIMAEGWGVRRGGDPQRGAAPRRQALVDVAGQARTG